MENPLPTVTAWDHNSVVTANLIQMNNHCDGKDIRQPLPTITAGDGHFGEVRAFLIKYYGQGTGQDISNYENGEDIFINKLIDQIYIINNCIQGNQFSHLRNGQITKIKEIFNEK